MTRQLPCTKLLRYPKKPNDTLCNFLRQSKTLHRSPVVDLNQSIRAHLPRSIRQRRLDVPRNDCVAFDVRIIKSGRSGYSCNTMLCCSISTRVAETIEGNQGADVENCSTLKW